MKPVRITRSTWDHEKGLVVFIGEDGTRMVMPLEALLPLAINARRLIAGRQARLDREASPPGWVRVNPTPVESFRVQTIETQTGNSCLLTLDPETESELQLSVQKAELVRQLGELLIEVSEQMSSETKPLS